MAQIKIDTRHLEKEIEELEGCAKYYYHRDEEYGCSDGYERTQEELRKKRSLLAALRGTQNG